MISLMEFITPIDWFYIGFSFKALSQKLQKATLLVPLCLSVCLSLRPSVRMERLSSHWMDFREI